MLQVGDWAVVGLQAVLGAVKSHRRGTGAREATGGPQYYRVLRRAADVVAGPLNRERAVGGLHAVLGSSSLTGAASELARRRADRGNADFCVAPRTSSRARGDGSGPSAACRPF